MKKLIVTFFIVITGIFLLNTKSFAAVHTATMKGITTNNLDYVSDFNTNYKEINGSRYYYGKIKLWTAVYKKYFSDSDTMYYVVFAQSFINGTNKTKKGYYHSDEMNVNIELRGKNVSEISYSPTEVELTYSTTESLNLSGTFGTENTVSIGYSYQETYNKSDIGLKINSNDYNNRANVNFIYDFLNSRKTKSSERSPYIGEYYTISATVFEVANYSKNDKLYTVDISYTGKIFRYSLTKARNYLMGLDIRHVYDIRDTVTYSYDVVGEAYDI
jgi:hypothetical protein